MWFILSAAISALCSVILTKAVVLVSDDFISLLKGPYSEGPSPLASEGRPSAEPQMTIICLFVTALFFSTFVQNHWLGLSFAAGLIGSAALLAFICALGLGFRASQWAAYGIGKLYRDWLNSLKFVDSSYAALKDRLR